jgi:type IV pilus assembly protein PilQ
MNNKQGNSMLNKIERFLFICLGLGLLLMVNASVQAGELKNLGVVALGDNKLQVQIEMSDVAILPKVFQTENPARIALDFLGAKNALSKKMYPVNQGIVSNIYVAAADDKVRVVVNLQESTSFETKVVGNKVLLTLSQAKPSATTAGIFSSTPGAAPAPAPVSPSVAQPAVQTAAAPPAAPVATRLPVVPVAAALPSARTSSGKSVIPSLMPAQNISGFDFKRGEKGEGRILISLANPNTIVNTRKQGGKVVLTFANTTLPGNLSKRLDVSEFATPVKFIDAVSTGRDSTMSVTLQNALYDYSTFQANGLLTVEFRPLTEGEKQAMERSRAKYTGDRLSLHFQDIEVRSVIAILAEFTGQNVVAGDDVTGTITLKLDDVPWDEALDFIMMTKDLGKYETGNVTLISPLDRIRTYKEKQNATERVVAALDPLVTEYIKINYASAGSIVSLLSGQSAGSNVCIATSNTTTATTIVGSNGYTTQTSTPVSPPATISTGGNPSGSGSESPDNQAGLGAVSTRGSVAVDQRTNTLIVRDTPKRLEEIKSLIHRLDVPVKQVMIESRIVIATDNFAKALGIKFGTGSRSYPGNQTAFALGGSGTHGTLATSTPSTSTGGVLTPGTVTGASTTIQDQLVNLAVAGTPTGALGMTLVRGADYVLNLELQALQTQGKGELISNPRVMTSDRCQAIIKQGVQIPYQSASAGTTAAVSTTQLVSAALTLDVTPQITPNGDVVMKLNITNDAPGSPTPTGQLQIDTRQIQTNVKVSDGETVMLGGIFQETIADGVNSVPFFADLPGVGFLFKNSNKTDNKTELLIFVTPKIVKDNMASAD